MPRPLRRFQHADCYHVINRANVRATLFFTPPDYQAFVDLLADATARFEIALFGYCVMPNHWHLVVLPDRLDALSRAMHWLTTTHARRWSHIHERPGPGHVYQGRFRSVPVQPGMSLCRVLRYVERNAFAADFVERAEHWRWGSAHQRHHGTSGPSLLDQPFLPREQWLEYLNSPSTDRPIADAIRRNLPIGDDAWVEKLRERAGLPPRRPRGRPRLAP